MAVQGGTFLWAAIDRTLNRNSFACLTAFMTHPAMRMVEPTDDCHYVKMSTPKRVSTYRCEFNKATNTLSA